jgi:hypothetical protein
MGQGGVSVAMEARFVRSAVRDGVPHPDGAGRRTLIEPVDGDDSSDTAHD